MRENVTSDPVPLTPSQEYLKVPVGVLMGTTPLCFQLFTAVGDELILYQPRDSRIDAVAEAELGRLGIERLYLPHADLDAYYSFLEDRMSRFLEQNDPHASVQYYETASAIAEQLLDEPCCEVLSLAVLTFIDVTMDRISECRSILELITRLRHSVDLYTHSLHTCLYGLALGETCEFERADLRALGLGLVLHDVGKLGLPMAAYDRAGPLGPEEWKLMRTHPRLGIEAVERNRLVGPVGKDVILAHHERLDGTGYPQGKTATSISTFARIAAIASTFDRRTMDTRYRKAQSSGTVLQGMIAEEGRFDLHLLARFIRLIS